MGWFDKKEETQTLGKTQKKSVAIIEYNGFEKKITRCDETIGEYSMSGYDLLMGYIKQANNILVDDTGQILMINQIKNITIKRDIDL